MTIVEILIGVVCIIIGIIVGYWAAGRLLKRGKG